MYLHLGGESNLRKSEILGIFDLDTASIAQDTKDYLKKAQQKGELLSVSDELPKSFVVSAQRYSKEKNQTERPKQQVWFCQISAAVLKKRCKES